jgi:predicted naringenin-chalcone synthase
MQKVYAFQEPERRKLKFLYHHSGIETRYSVIGDYNKPLNEWKFYPPSESLEPFPSLELRMAWYQKWAAPLSVDAIRQCLDNHTHAHEITHLITVSCTGMSAPGLDLQVMELLDLPRNIYRSSINFMGCYAAIHALKMADDICRSRPLARVMIVCTELCTLHFQKEGTADNIASSLLFGDGAAAVLITPDDFPRKGWQMQHFYSEILSRGKKDMSWELSSTGFQMTLSGYIADLLEEDFSPLVSRALASAGLGSDCIGSWCIHPGGKRILDLITKSLGLPLDALQHSYDIMRDYGNMSSPTLLFVLKKMMQDRTRWPGDQKKILGAAFGPGLTMETFLLSGNPV